MSATPAFARRYGARAYASVDAESAVAAASTQRIVCMLHDRIDTEIAAAERAMREGDIPGKGLAIGRAMRFIDNGLAVCVDRTMKNDLVRNLLSMYDYASRRLLQANIENSEAVLAEVRGLMGKLASAWRQADGHGRDG